MILTKDANSQGAMVALYPSAEIAEALSQEGGEPVEELHLTLAFLGDARDVADPAAVAQAVEIFAAAAGPLTGVVSGIGHFTAGPEPVTYASPDLPGLPVFRHELVEALNAAGAGPSNEHGFTPHITLAYDHVDPEIPNLALAFNTISLVMAGERTDYPLTGKQAGERTAMNSKQVKREVTVPLWKDDAKQIVYGVVMQPDVPDSAGDWQSAEDIEKTAHRYLAESRKHDVQHDEQTAEVTTIESFIAPHNMTIAGKEVLKGSWVMAVHIADPEVWGEVQKGELTGFSIGGTGIRVED